MFSHETPRDASVSIHGHRHASIERAVRHRTGQRQVGLKKSAGEKKRSGGKGEKKSQSPELLTAIKALSLPAAVSAAAPAWT